MTLVPNTGLASGIATVISSSLVELGIIPVTAPTDLTNLRLWLDAADSTTITESGGSVSQWRDKSGNLRHANQGEGAAQPTTGSSIGGLNAISFTGNSIRMDSASASFLSGAYTLYVVAELDSASSTNNYFIGTETAVVDQGLHLGWSSPTVYRHAHYADDKDYTLTQTADPKIYTSYFNNGGSELKVNNSSIGTSAFPQNPLATSTALRIGTGRVLSENWDGTIGEMILLTRSASAEDNTNIYNYLSAKWGIS